MNWLEWDLLILALGLVFLVPGLLMIHGGRKRRPIFVDPPRYLIPIWPQAFCAWLFGPRVALIVTYVMGAGFAFIGGILVLTFMLGTVDYLRYLLDWHLGPVSPIAAQ